MYGVFLLYNFHTISKEEYLELRKFNKTKMYYSVLKETDYPNKD